MCACVFAPRNAENSEIGEKRELYGIEISPDLVSTVFSMVKVPRNNPTSVFNSEGVLEPVMLMDPIA